jgi:putative serine/threonine protein kinase
LDEDYRLVIPIEQVSAEPYSPVISYPSRDTAVLISRIRQLKELGVSDLEFTGPLKLGRLSLLGKGVAGVVVIGRTGKRRAALKVRRADSRRENVKHEVSMLKAANTVGVGPVYYGSTDDVILMELIEGNTLPDWLSTLTGRGRRSRFRNVTCSLFEQCHRLDDARIDHGELSRAHKNVCVTVQEQPVILDFESASTVRSTNNLTSIAQYFYLGGGFARRAGRILGPTDSDRLKGALRLYKSERTAESFLGLKQMLRLAS